MERQPTGQSEEDTQGTARRRAKAYQAVMEAVFAIPIGLGIGWWVDRQLGSEPIGLFVGLALGFAAFIVRLARMRGMVDREAAEAAARQKERSE
jgi:F0F1-type ATP synthase assembly protein I